MARNKIKTIATDAQKTEAAEKITTGDKNERWVLAVVILAIIIVLLVCIYRRHSSYSLTIDPLEVSHKNVPIEKAVANSTDVTLENPGEIMARSSQNILTVKGIVLYKLLPVSKSNVYIAVSGNVWGPYGVGLAKTEKDGTFRIEGNVNTVDHFSPEEIVISARGGEIEINEKDENGKEVKKNKPLAYHGQRTLDINGQFSRRNVNIPASTLAVLPIIFLLSLGVAFVRARQPKWKRLKHSTSILLAFLFTLSVIYAIASGLKYVQTEGRRGEVLSLGYASLFKGSYSAYGPKEWIFSFTSPKKVLNADGSAAVVPGSETGRSFSAFGAPLWVILLSVIGASISTVSLIVRETKDTLDYENEENKFWQRIQHIVQHQFLILFSPLGAIFVYQILVAAGAIHRPVTVALAALGAGPTINYLLAKAIHLSKNLVESNGNATKEITDESSDKGFLRHKPAA